tara:strand:+ start:693 stop:845 length:153 start_codon:yes stop_codon:yes gene_type:complete
MMNAVTVALKKWLILACLTILKAFFLRRFSDIIVQNMSPTRGMKIYLSES